MLNLVSVRVPAKKFHAAIAIFLTAMLGGVVTIPANSQAPGQERPGERRGPLTNGDRAKLALLSLRGIRQVHVHVACRPGMTATVAQQIEARGGTIRFRADEIDYLRAWLPFGGLDSVTDVASLAGVDAVAVSWSGQSPSPTASFPVDASPNAGRDSRLPTLATPHSLAADLDATDFFRECPTCDGRGVTIAILDGVPDLLHPNLQRALDLEGRPIRKFLDATSTARAFDEPGDEDWARMRPPVQSEQGQISLNGSRYRVPREGTYRIGSIPRQRMGSYEAWVPLAIDGRAPPAIDRDDRTHQIAVLWDEADDTVWVDTNVNGSFADEQALRPYRVRGDVGVFGRDDPATPIRESIGFTITIDHEGKAVRINPAWQIHGTVVSGAAAGEGYLGGRFDAIAGKARLALYEISSAIHSYNMVDTVLEAARDSEVDIVVIERTSIVFGDYTLHDGRNAISIAVDRIAERFRKPIFVTPGNFGGLDSASEPSTAQHVIAIGAYDSAQALRTYHAIDPPYSDNLHRVGTFGPGGDGRLKPDLVAPATQLTTDSLFASALSTGLTGHYQLPAGNTLCGGTSCATPIAASAAAILISAAKQQHVRWDGDRLKYALYSTGRPLDRIPTYRQGRGLIQIGEAWDVLKRLDKIADWTPAEINVSAPVKTATSRLLQQPDRGRGIYEKEGWGPNQSGRREIVFTRRNGPKEPTTYRLDWHGDREAFSSAPRLTLPLNEPVALPVDITTGESGVYSAVLRLTEVGMLVEATAVLNTVVAAADLDADSQFVMDGHVAVDRPGMTSLFFRVPRGMSALQITAAKSSPEELAIYYRSPDLSRVEGNRVHLREGTKHVMIPNPQEGVWELCLDSRALLMDIDPSWNGKLEPRPNPLTPTDVRIVVKALRVEVSAEKSHPGGARASMHNRAAALRARPVWQGVGSEVRQSWDLRPNQQQSFDVSVPAGTKFLKVEVDEVSEPADVRLLLYEVIDGQAILRSWMANAHGSVPIAVRDPKPGTWKAVLDIQSTHHANLRGIYRQIVAHDCPDNALPSLPPFRLDGRGTWTQTFACRLVESSAGERPVGVMLFDALPAVENHASDLTEVKPLIDVIFP